MRMLSLVKLRACKAFKNYAFASTVLVWLFFYVLLYLTPSSYGYVLTQLGMQGQGLFFGIPQAIRSDEWAVWTPYMQSLVNNGFQRFNALSLYHEDFRNFNALPIYDWSLFFKPQYWAFLVLEPARAFSFAHGFVIAAFLIGWQQLFEQLLKPYLYATKLVFILFAFLLYFSGFVQGWWTTLGPVLAFFPWLMIVLFSWTKNSVGYYLLLTYVATTWLLSQLYPPVIISCAYVGLFLIAAFQPTFFRSPLRILLSLLACVLAIVIVAYYFKDVIPVMMATVYPGQRISTGGEVPWFLWLASFVPYITHSYLEPLRSNICEAGTVSSLLSVLTLCFLDYKKITIKNSWEIRVLFICVLLFSLWMLLPIPHLIGKIFLLCMIPGARLLFALGVLVNGIALVMLLKYGVHFSYKRGLVYSGLLLLIWNVPVIYSDIAFFQKSALELISLPIIMAVIFLVKKQSLSHINAVNTLVFTACLINVLYFIGFNPLQSAQPIFSAKQSPIVSQLHALEKKDTRGWLITSDFNGAVLNGLGLKSFTHTLIQPRLAFFRTLFPALPEAYFNYIFNRYAHIVIYDGEKIRLPSSDLIWIPSTKIGGKASKKEWRVVQMKEAVPALSGGSLGRIIIRGNQLIVSGWLMSEVHHFASNLEIKKEQVLSAVKFARPDVAKALDDVNLLFSGFNIVILLSDENKIRLKKEGFCLQSISDVYGRRVLNREDQNPLFVCRNKVRQY